MPAIRWYPNVPSSKVVLNHSDQADDTSTFQAVRWYPDNLTSKMIL